MATAPAEDFPMEHTQDADVLIDLADEDDHDQDQDQSQASLQDFLQPLQDTAERVSQQVEEFAKKLDKFKQDLPPNDQDLWDNAFLLLSRFNNVTKSRQQQSRNTRSFNADGDNEAQNEKLGLEADLWVLTKNLLLARSPKALDEATTAQDESLRNLHRYSSTSDIWNAFLDSDVIAQEYEIILDWLQERALADGEISTKTDGLMRISNRGEVRSAAPLFTSGNIKQRKRAIARGGPLPAGSNSNFVSQLDPDAASRQGAQLDPQDASYEEAAWSTCWEMLRRGMTFKEIRQWWSDANEPYRTVLLTVCGQNSGDYQESKFLRIMNLARSTQWLKVCSAAAKDSHISNEQRAVFGLLSGESGSSDSACHSLEDFFHSSINALLIERYLHFAAAYRLKLERRTQDVYQPKPNDRSRIADLITRMRSKPELREQLQMPHKVTEMALMGLDLDDFLLDVGRAVEHINRSNEKSRDLFSPGGGDPIDDNIRLLAADEDSTRILAHLQIVLHALGQLDRGYGIDPYLMENNIVNYIVYLRDQKKLSTIPLYVSKLSEERAYDVLGSILVKVTADKERAPLVRLLRRYGMHVSNVISAVVFKANEHINQRFEDNNITFKAPRITSAAPKEQTQIQTDFMSDRVSHRDRNSIAAVEWYRWIDEYHWDLACANMAALYKLWLVEGNFSALKHLAEKAKLADISLAAFSMNLSLMSDDELEENGDMIDDEDGDPRSRSPRKRRSKPSSREQSTGAHSRTQLYEKSAIWLELEQVVNALQVLEAWQAVADDVQANRGNMVALQDLKRELRQGLVAIEAAVEPLLEPSFLEAGIDSDETGILMGIRTHYLPEIVLGYNSALFLAGKAISRNHLITCMELANTVAATPSLTDAFVQSGRMRELVNALALDSQTLLSANETGGRKSMDKKPKGFDIWNVQWKDMKDGTLEAVK